MVRIRLVFRMAEMAAMALMIPALASCASSGLGQAPEMADGELLDPMPGDTREARDSTLAPDLPDPIVADIPALDHGWDPADPGPDGFDPGHKDPGSPPDPGAVDVLLDPVSETGHAGIDDPCGSDADCKPGLRCHPDELVCVACLVSDDCQGPYFCHAFGCVPWKCVPASRFCVWNTLVTCADDGSGYAKTEDCLDADPCTTGEGCEGTRCLDPVPVDCDDQNPCTIDACDPASGCVHVAQTGPCDDKNPCTMKDACADGVCAGVPNPCDDDNPCTSDQCLPDIGCRHDPVDGSCDDNDACTSGDSCAEGRCAGKVSVFCDDGDACSADRCVPETGACEFLPVQGCQHCTSDAACNDGNDCSVDLCLPSGACQHLPAPLAGCCESDADCAAAGACLVPVCVAGPLGHCEKRTIPGEGCCVSQPYLFGFSSGTLDGFVGDPLIAGVGWTLVQTPAASSPPWALYYGNPETHAYDNGQANHGSVTSPAIALPAGKASFVTFSFWQDVEDSESHDVLSLDVLDGTRVFPVWKRPPGTPMKQIVPVIVDISPLAGRFVRLRFTFDTGDGLANQTEGVYVDDVAVESPCTPRPCESGADCVQFGLIGMCQLAGCDYSAPFVPLFTAGSGGNDPGKFDDPFDVVLSPDGLRLYVSDKDNHRIQVLDASGNFLFAFGSSGTGEGQFSSPHGLSIANGRLYVADTGNARVQVFTLAGVPMFSFGKKGKEPGFFQDPKAVLATGDALYVADTSNHRIQVFDPDGGFLATFGKYGKEDGNFRSPSCVVMTEDGRLLVCDIQNARIQILTPTGEFLGKIQPKDAAAFGNPYDVAIGPGGRLWVADTYYHRIQVFLADGTFDFRFGSFGSSPQQFAYPMGMAFGPLGRLFVVDTSNHRLSVWGPTE